MKKYIIIRNHNKAEFENSITELLNRNYKPHGNLIMIEWGSNYTYIQAMIKE